MALGLARSGTRGERRQPVRRRHLRRGGGRRSEPPRRLVGGDRAGARRREPGAAAAGKAAMVEPLGDAPIPFEELITPSGQAGMRGFPEGRFRGESGLVGTVEYRWYISSYLDASLFTDVGDGGGAGLPGDRVGSLVPELRHRAAAVQDAGPLLGGDRPHRRPARLRPRRGVSGACSRWRASERRNYRSRSGATQFLRTRRWSRRGPAGMIRDAWWKHAQQRSPEIQLRRGQPSGATVTPLRPKHAPKAPRRAPWRAVVGFALVVLLARRRGRLARRARSPGRPALVRDGDRDRTVR